MSLFVLDVLLRPRKEQSLASAFAGARANIWVRADTLDEARIKACDRFHDSEWLVEKIERELPTKLELHPWNQQQTQPTDPMLREGARVSWEQLQAHGIGCEIFAFRQE